MRDARVVAEDSALVGEDFEELAQMARLVLEVVALRRRRERHVHGGRRAGVEGVEEGGDAGERFGGGEEGALVDGLFGEEFGVG